MPDWVMPLLPLIAMLAIFYRAFLHTPRAPPSGKNHEESVTNYWDSRGRLEQPDREG